MTHPIIQTHTRLCLEARRRGYRIGVLGAPGPFQRQPRVMLSSHERLRHRLPFRGPDVLVILDVTHGLARQVAYGNFDSSA
jgi:hypothetical protein